MVELDVEVDPDDAMPIVSTTCDFGCTCVFSSGLWLTTMPTLASSGLRNVATEKPFDSRSVLASASVLPTSPGTDTDCAPWHVIASDNKLHARLKGLKIVVDEIGKGIDITQPPLDPKIAEAAFKLWGWKPDEKNKKKNDKKN